MNVNEVNLSTDFLGHRLRTPLAVVKKALFSTPRPNLPGWKVGIGLAAAYKNVGLGSGIPDGAGARISLQNELPATPERVLAALQNRDSS